MILEHLTFVIYCITIYYSTKLKILAGASYRNRKLLPNNNDFCLDNISIMITILFFLERPYNLDYLKDAFTHLLGIRWHHINAEEETASHSPKFKDKCKATQLWVFPRRYCHDCVRSFIITTCPNNNYIFIAIRQTRKTEICIWQI